MIVISPEFREEIKKDNTKLYIIAILEIPTKRFGNVIRLSTNSITKDGEYYHPLLMSIRGLSVSMHLTKYNYKVKNAGLYITNREYEGAKFGDFDGDDKYYNSFQSLLVHTKAQIYFTSNTLTLEQSAKVFDGYIVKASQNELYYTLTIEDRVPSRIEAKFPQELLYNQFDIMKDYKDVPNPILFGVDNVDKLVHLYNTPSETLHSDWYDTFQGKYLGSNAGFIPCVISNDHKANMATTFTEDGGIKFYVATDYSTFGYQWLLKILSIERFGWDEIEDNMVGEYYEGQIIDEGNASGFLLMKHISFLNHVADGSVITVASETDFNVLTSKEGHFDAGIIDEDQAAHYIDGAYKMDSYPGLEDSGHGWFANSWKFHHTTNEYVHNDLDFWWDDNFLEGEPNTKALTLTPKFVKDAQIDLDPKDTYVDLNFVLKVSIIGGTPQPEADAAAAEGYLAVSWLGYSRKMYAQIGGEGGYVTGEGAGCTRLTGDMNNMSTWTPSSPLVFRFDTSELDNYDYDPETGGFDYPSNAIWLTYSNPEEITVTWHDDTANQSRIAMYVEVESVDYKIYQTKDIHSTWFDSSYSPETGSFGTKLVSEQPVELLEITGVPLEGWEYGMETIVTHVPWLNKYGALGGENPRSTAIIRKPKDLTDFVEDYSRLYKFSLRYNENRRLTVDCFKSTYSLTGTSVTKEIDVNKVIKYSFNRTPRTQLYTRIICPYGWSEATKSFKGQVELSVLDYHDPTYNGWLYVEDPNVLPENTIHRHYSYQYYGLVKDGEIDETTSIYTIPSNLAKLIPDNELLPEGEEARRIAELWLAYHMNLHLIISIELPISYIELEVGDSISFSEEMGGIHPFGLEYNAFITKADLGNLGLQLPGQWVNGQQLYNAFLITKISKTIDRINITCVQAHCLDTSKSMIEAFMEVDSPTVSCGIPSALNYGGSDGDYMVDNTLCVFPVISSSCPVPGVDFEGTEEIEAGYLNFTNYTDSGLNPENDNIFLLEDYFVEADCYAAARVWYEEVGMALDIVPTIVTLTNCIVEETGDYYPPGVRWWKSEDHPVDFDFRFFHRLYTPLGSDLTPQLSPIPEEMDYPEGDFYANGSWNRLINKDLSLAGNPGIYPDGIIRNSFSFVYHSRPGIQLDEGGLFKLKGVITTNKNIGGIFDVTDPNQDDKLLINLLRIPSGIEPDYFAPNYPQVVASNLPPGTYPDWTHGSVGVPVQTFSIVNITPGVYEIDLPVQLDSRYAFNLIKGADYASDLRMHAFTTYYMMDLIFMPAGIHIIEYGEDGNPLITYGNTDAQDVYGYSRFPLNITMINARLNMDQYNGENSSHTFRWYPGKHSNPSDPGPINAQDVYIHYQFFEEFSKGGEGSSNNPITGWIHSMLADLDDNADLSEIDTILEVE